VHGAGRGRVHRRRAHVPARLGHDRIATATLRGLPFTTSLFGAVVGFLVVWLPFIFLYKGLLGRTGMGMGDAKLLALAGAWFGWPGAVFVLFAGALQGSLYALVTRVLGIESKLPQAVLDDIAQLEKDAAEGDEEAKKALDEDPLTENEDDAFILRWLGIRKRTSEPEPAEGDTHDAQEDVPVARARIPFGPFLILGILELLFMSDWIQGQLSPLFGPM